MAIRNAKVITMMNYKRLASVLVLSSILDGCASYVAVNEDCNVPTKPFTDIVTCINKATAGSTNDYMMMYSLRANQLFEQYKAGKITETDAKAKLQEQYLALRQQHINAVAAVSAISQPVNCKTRGKNTTCY